jgi:hypothetical protein
MGQIQTHAMRQAALLEHLVAATAWLHLHCHDASVLSCAFFLLHFALLSFAENQRLQRASGLSHGSIFVWRDRRRSW